MQDCIYDWSNYYANIFIFVQRNKMGKLKFVDVFGKSSLMINFILYKDAGQLFDNTEILQFMLSEPPDKVQESVNKLLQKKFIALGNFLVKAKKTIVI